MSNLVLPSSSIALVCPPNYAGLHITSARLRLGDHHFCHRQYLHPSLDRRFDLSLIIAELEFMLLDFAHQIAIVAAHSRSNPCRLVTRRNDPEMIKAISQLPNVEFWRFWPTKEEAQTDLAEILGVELSTSPY